MYSKVFRVLVFPFLTLIFWWVVTWTYSVFKIQSIPAHLAYYLAYLLVIIPFSMASVLFWFEKSPKQGFILGMLGGFLSWILLIITLGGIFNPQKEFPLLFILTTFSSGLTSWLVISLRKQ